MELNNIVTGIFTETAKILKGSDRRVFMAQVVKALGKVDNDGLKRNWDGIVAPLVKG